MFSTLRVTSSCNLQCRHCYSANSNKERELSADEFSSVIDILVKKRVNHITISGGEPFTRPDICDILAYSSKKAKTGIVCNGTLLSNTIAERLADIELSHLMISLDGIGTVHNNLRGKGAYRQAEKGINNSLNHNLPLGISTTLTCLNCTHIMDIYDFLCENNIRRWIIETVKPVGRAKDADIYLDTQSEHHITETLTKLNASNPNIKISVYDCKDNCTAGIKTISINPNGDVTPCAFMPHAVCGNILKDIWKTIDANLSEFHKRGIKCFQNY